MAPTGIKIVSKNKAKLGFEHQNVIHYKRFRILLQLSPDFSNTGFFEFPDFSNYFFGPVGLIPPIFRILKRGHNGYGRKTPLFLSLSKTGLLPANIILHGICIPIPLPLFTAFPVISTVAEVIVSVRRKQNTQTPIFRINF